MSDNQWNANDHTGRIRIEISEGYALERDGQSQFVKAPIDEDSVDRIMSCVRSLAEFTQKKELETVWLDETRKAFRAMVQVEEKKRAAKEALEKAKGAIQVDDVVQIRQLSKKNTSDGLDESVLDLERATGGEGAAEDLSSKLSRVVQLTGFSDPVYAEAYVKVSIASYFARFSANDGRSINSISFWMYS